MSNNDSSLGIKQVLFITLFFESIFVALAIAYAVALDKSPKTYFGEIDNSGYITYLSFLQLLISGVLSLKIFNLVKSAPQLYKSGFFWLIIGMGWFGLALDDVVGIHEQIDLWLHDLIGVEPTRLTDLIDDFIVGGYLAIALVYIASKWQTIKVFRQSFIFFKLGFLLTFAMVLLDVVSNNTFFISLFTSNLTLQFTIQQWLGAIEDSSKIFAEGMFIVGTYKCWQIAKRLSREY